jgi:IclR family acetate operon transcriptional repressor
MSDASPRRDGHVQSLTRALSILGAVADSHDGMTLTEIAQRLTLPPSTVHRLLTTLEGEGFVRCDPAQGLWQVGIRAFIIGNAFTRTRDVIAIARPPMRRLMEESGETVNLYLLEEDEAVCMGQVESRQMMRAIARPGGRLRLHCSGAGKAMLAALNPDEQTRLIRRTGLPRLTARTHSDPAALMTDLALSAARGWALDDEEHAIGLRCVAAAICDEHGNPVAAVSLSGPMARLTDERLPAIGAAVARTARTITAHYDGGGPD